MAGGGDGWGSSGSESSAAGGSVTGGGIEPVPLWGDIRSGERYMVEIYRRGEPEMRPDVGRICLPRTAGMAEQTNQFRGRALFAVVMGNGVRVTADDMLSSIEHHCGVPKANIIGEVCAPPFHFFLRFDSSEDCTRVVLASEKVRCGRSWVRFERWNVVSRGTIGKMEYKTCLSFEGLPEDAWEPQAVKLLIAGLHGKLIEILPSVDRWVLTVTAWLRDPCDVPKVLTVTVPASSLLAVNPRTYDEGESPPRQYPQKLSRTVDYTVIIHVKEVIDRGDLLSDVPSIFLPGAGEDLTRRHTFPTWRGKIDGTGAGDHGLA